MGDFLNRLWSQVTAVLGRPAVRQVHRTSSHPWLGELRFSGSQIRPGGPVSGAWELMPPGFEHRVRVTFPSAGELPEPRDLAELERILRDLDGIVERARPATADEYEAMVREPLPADWRTALRLDDIELPDPEEEEPWWRLTFWSEAAQHWLVLTFEGETLIDAGMEG